MRLRGDVSSQYLTALMLIAPLLEGGLRLELTTPLVSLPYVRLTAAVMAAFGVADVDVDRRRASPSRRGATRARRSTIEPDASSASYPLAIAAVRGGAVHGRRAAPPTRCRATSPSLDLLGGDGLRRRRSTATRVTVARDAGTTAPRHRRRHGRRCPTSCRRSPPSP